MKEMLTESLMKELTNEGFAKAREEVENLLGINLSLIELAELRKDAEFTHKLYFEDLKRFNIQNGGDKHSINPFLEAALIFMNRNYGVQIGREDYKLEYYKFFSDRKKLKHKLGFDYYPFYFKRVQEEMHFP